MYFSARFPAQGTLPSLLQKAAASDNMGYRTASCMEVTAYDRRGGMAYTLLYDPRFRTIHTIRSIPTRGETRWVRAKIRYHNGASGPVIPHPDYLTGSRRLTELQEYRILPTIGRLFGTHDNHRQGARRQGAQGSTRGLCQDISSSERTSYEGDVVKHGSSNPQEENAFNSFRTALLNPSVLQLPRHIKPYTLDPDASADQLGCALQLEGEDGILKPVGYCSSTLKPAERNYSTKERLLGRCVGHHAPGTIH